MCVRMRGPKQIMKVYSDSVRGLLTASVFLNFFLLYKHNNNTPSTKMKNIRKNNTIALVTEKTIFENARVSDSVTRGQRFLVQF